MIRRKRIVQARLTWEEVERFEPLIKQRFLWNWSELIRASLRRYWQESQPTPSDNGVIHPDPLTNAGARRRPVKKKPTRSAASGRGKSKV